MEQSLYPMIFKRKSFHIFKNTGHISAYERNQIRAFFSSCKPLRPDIPVDIKIVPADRTTCKRGIMPADKVSHYNRIDTGIFLCFLDLCLMENNIDFQREIFTDSAEDDSEKVLIAKYILP